MNSILDCLKTLAFSEAEIKKILLDRRGILVSGVPEQQADLQVAQKLLSDAVGERNDALIAIAKAQKSVGAPPAGAPIPPAPTEAPTRVPPEWKADEGDTYWHEPTGGRVITNPDGSYSLTTRSGERVGESFSTAYDAFAEADQLGWNESLPPNWRRDDNGVIYHYTEDTEDPWDVRGRKGLWELQYRGNHIQTFTGSLADALKAFEGKIARWQGTEPPATPAAVATPPPSAPARGDNYISSFEATPEEMLAQRRYDPELYHGLVDGLEVRKVQGKNEWEATLPPAFGPMHLDPMGYADVMERLTDATNFDVTALPAKDLASIYDNNFLQRVSEYGAVPFPAMGASVRERFGEDRLRAISAASAVRADNLTFVPGFSTEANSAVRIQGEPFPPELAKTYQKNATGRPISIDQKTIAEEFPGIYTDAKLSEVGKKSAAVVSSLLDRLRRVFAPDVKILLTAMPEMNSGSKFGAGYSRPLAPGVHQIALELLESDRVFSRANLLYAAAHEFGHVVITEFFGKALPSVKAEIVKGWLESTRDAKADTPLMEYLAKHNSHPRDDFGSPATLQDNTSPAYFTSLSEHMADQAAQMFLEREAGNASPEVQTWYNKLLQILSQLYERIGRLLGKPIEFQKNHPFHAWLNELAARGEKASAGRSNTAGQPGITADDINTAPPKPGIRVLSRQQADALIDNILRITDALHEAGATLEEIQALSPTGLAGDFNFHAAEKLAVKYGVDKSKYWGRYLPGELDDTYGFRTNLAGIATRTHDPELRYFIGAASAAVKNFNWLLQRTITAVQLRKRYGAQVPGVKAFVDTLEKMMSYRSRWKEQADARVKQMKRTSRAERAKVFDIMLEEDKTGTYSSTITMGTRGRVFTLDPLIAKKNGLSEAGVALYSEMRADFDTALTEMENESVKELERTYGASTPALVKAEAELRDGFNKMKARPYVPHTRFGDHTVSVREGGVLREFYQFEYEHQAKSMEARLRAENGAGVAVSRGKLTEQQRMMMGLPPQLVNAMKQSLNLSPEQIGKFEDILKDMSNGASFVRRFKRRKNIEGWEDDAAQFPRAYADYMSRFANQISRMRYNHQLGESIAGVRSQATEDSKLGANTVELNDLANWLGRLHDYINQPGTEFANARAAATIWYLGLLPKSALVNATSVPMVSFPYLSKRFGFSRSFAEIAQAYKDIAKQYTRMKALTDDERAFLEQMRHENKIDASFASELAGLREGGRLSDQMSLSTPGSVLYGVKFYAMWMFQKIEVINREVTGLAAYRLRRTSKSFSDVVPYDQAASDFAGLAIQDTQNENAQWNRSEFMRGRKSIFTMFMSYQQNILYQMMGGDESWGRMLAVQMMVAGLLGLPFAQDLDELIKWFSRRVFGSDINAEKAVREYLKGTMVSPDWVLQGASQNVFGVNLQGSLSQGKVIPGMDALAMEGDFPSRLANMAGDVGGAGFSIVLNLMKAVASNDPDYLRRFQRSYPEFFRAGAEGVQMLTSGVAKDASGNAIAEVDPAHAVARMAGFQPANVSQEKEKRFAQKDTAAFWLTRRQYVLAMYEMGLKEHNSDIISAAKDALREFNDEAPDRGLRITAQQLRESLRRRIKGDQRDALNLGPSNTVTGTYRRVGEGY